MSLRIKTIQSITVQDWDDLVTKTYGRPYRFQQQNGCQERGVHNITVPCEDPYDFEDNDPVEEDVDTDNMGVTFETWLARDPKKPIKGNNYRDMWYERNFYPSIEMVANDLHAKGLLPAGEYQIVIDW